MNGIRKVGCRVYQELFHLAIPFLPYRDPEQTNSLEDIPVILRKNRTDRVLVVTDRGLEQAGVLDILRGVLERGGIEYVVYADTVANPTIENVESARQMYIDFGARAIIALGGGSSMDCAKAAGARIVKPKQQIPQMKGILHVHKRLPLLIAVPTTAGTGSETTLAAVITDSQKHHKYPINDFPLIPRYAVLDYHLTTGLPKSITATTGMDALTHAIEAYIGRSTTKQTRAMAVEATGLIHKYLYRAYTNGQDAEARQKMLRAAYCAGLAFSKSYVGYVHAVAHSLGGQYGTPHGLANAILLPIVLKEYGSAIYAKLGRLGRMSGVAAENVTDKEAAEVFIRWIEQMNRDMQIPSEVADIREEDIPTMAQYADKEANPLYPVPVLMDAKELEHLYRISMSRHQDN